LAGAVTKEYRTEILSYAPQFELAVRPRDAETPPETPNEPVAQDDVDLRESRRKVASKLGEIFEAKRRLTRLRSDYVVIERSKFSRLRSLWLILKSLLGLGSKRDRFAAISNEAGLSASVVDDCSDDETSRC
jgi:hypothetical protein